MQISAKTDYACKALLELALHWPNKDPLQINTIAQRQNIPMKFLTQILIFLKQLGLTQSVRGKHGGYLLAMAPDKIRLSEIYQSLGNVAAVSGVPKQKRHVFTAIWQEIDATVWREMEKITFEDIANRTRRMDQAVNFEI